MLKINIKDQVNYSQKGRKKETLPGPDKIIFYALPASDIPLLIVTQVRNDGENPPLTAEMELVREYLKV